MPLLDLYREGPAQVREKQINQLIAFAGEGVLRDGNSTSQEFRAFLGAVAAADLQRLANECLTVKFDGSGLALQDVVNQVGRRLGFSVEDGRYRGVPGDIGFDGLWRAPEGHELVVEVKTTDSYRIDLAKVGDYRRALIRDGRIHAAESSILIVVGRQDTGDLEAQIRGSREAWDVRLISVDYLLKLMHVKEGLEDPDTARRIRRVLAPQEFTRVDGIVDLLFSTTEDIKQEDLRDEEEGDADDEPREKAFPPVAFHEACVAKIAVHMGLTFVRQSRAVFQTPDGDVGLVCAVSREYDRATGKGYWYAFHPHQAEQLHGRQQAYVAFGCGSPDKVLVIPFDHFERWLEEFNQTVLESGRFYWHVRIQDEGDRLYLTRKGGAPRVELDQYRV